MAHEIQVPVSFDFRTTQIQWMEGHGRVVRWRRTGTEVPNHLIAEVQSAGEQRVRGIPLSSLPENERRLCLATIGERHADEAVREICSAVDIPYFVHDHQSYIEDSELVKHSRPADPWHLREDLLRLKPDCKAVMAFLNDWGRWLEHRKVAALLEIVQLQRGVREALTSSRGKWLASPYAFPTMKRSGSPKFPYFTMLTDACQVAIRMTTTIDLLRESKFKTCARPDCCLPFQVKSGHRRDYCSQYCGHLESVRRGRKTKATSQHG